MWGRAHRQGEEDLKKPVKATYKSEVVRILALLSKDAMPSIYEYDIDVVFDKPQSYFRNESVLAQVDVDIVYLSAVISPAPTLEDYWNLKNYEKVGWTLCHELCHILTEPLYDMAWDVVSKDLRDTLNDVRERQTERICKIIMNLIDHREFSPA